MHRSLSLRGALRSRTQLAAPCSASHLAAAALPAVAASAALPRLLHSLAPLHHNRPQWIPRSAAYFREKAIADRAALEASLRDRQVPAPYTGEHGHPAPLPAQAFEPREGYRVPPAHFAIMRFRNEQFKVVEDDLLMVNRVSLAVGSRVLVPHVLLLGGRDRTLIGRPTIPGALVVATVEEHTQTAKVVVFHKKRRKHHKKKQGHRDQVSMLRIEKIFLPQGEQSLTVGAKVEYPSAEQLQQAEEEEIQRTLGGMQRKAEEEEQQQLTEAAASTHIPTSSSSTSTPLGARAYSTSARPFASTRSFSTTASATPAATTEESLRALLQEQLSTSFLAVEDTSGGCGAFFRLVVVSPKFAGLSLVKQHRLVNETLKAHIANLHGLQLNTFTEEQWKKHTEKQQ